MNNEIETIWKGESIELLKALHLLTREGKLNADARRKLKQVNHLTQLIAPLIEKIVAKHAKIRVVDMGAGKSYLGFILYDLILKHLSDFEMVSIESRPELIDRSKVLATQSGFDKMKFVHASIENARVEGTADLVCALHACDTATDDSILFGLRHEAKAFALVPCCQAEVAQSLAAIQKQNQGSEAAFLYEQPLHRREFGSHLTNVIRTLFLRSKGYRVTVTELVGWEHSMKNELILAEKISSEDHPESKRAATELATLLQQFPVKMKLLEKSYRE